MSRFGFIFDLDGTLIDSSEQIFNILNQKCEEFSVTRFDRNVFDTVFGQPLDIMLSQNGIKGKLAVEFTKSFREALELEIHKSNILFDGVEEILSRLTTFAIPIGIASSKPTRLVKLVYMKSKLQKYRITIVGTDHLPPKPNPAIIIKAMKDMNINRGFMVGDRIEDCIAGTEAGLNTIAVMQSAHGRQEFEPLNPAFVFRNMRELSENLESLIGV